MKKSNHLGKCVYCNNKLFQEPILITTYRVGIERQIWRRTKTGVIEYGNSTGISLEKTNYFDLGWFSVYYGICDECIQNCINTISNRLKADLERVRNKNKNIQKRKKYFNRNWGYYIFVPLVSLLLYIVYRLFVDGALNLNKFVIVGYIAYFITLVSLFGIIERIEIINNIETNLKIISTKSKDDILNYFRKIIENAINIISLDHNPDHFRSIYSKKQLKTRKWRRIHGSDSTFTYKQQQETLRFIRGKINIIDYHKLLDYSNIETTAKHSINIERSYFHSTIQLQDLLNRSEPINLKLFKGLLSATKLYDKIFANLIKNPIPESEIELNNWAQHAIWHIGW